MSNIYQKYKQIPLRTTTETPARATPSYSLREKQSNICYRKMVTNTLDIGSTCWAQVGDKLAPS